MGNLQLFEKSVEIDTLNPNKFPITISRQPAIFQEITDRRNANFEVFGSLSNSQHFIDAHGDIVSPFITFWLIISNDIVKILDTVIIYDIS